jgi:hypothetical protein
MPSGTPKPVTGLDRRTQFPFSAVLEKKTEMPVCQVVRKTGNRTRSPDPNKRVPHLRPLVRPGGLVSVKAKPGGSWNGSAMSMSIDAVVRVPHARLRPVAMGPLSTLTLLMIGLAVGGLVARYIDYATRSTEGFDQVIGRSPESGRQSIGLPSPRGFQRSHRVVGAT